MMIRNRTMLPLADPASFGRAVKAARAAAGLTQDDVALASGVSRRLVRQVEQGHPGTRLELALRVAAAVGLGIEGRRAGDA